MSSILTVLVIAVVLLCFVWFEFILRILYAFGSRKKAYELSLRYETRAIHLIFSLLATYRGFRITYENCLNGPLPRRFLVVSNHQSLFDIPLIMEMMPKDTKARFVAKKSLGRGIPLISFFLNRLGHALVQQDGDPVHAMQAIEKMMLRSRKEGTLPVIFPEGHRSTTGALRPFHSAGFRKMLEVDPLPILVVCIDGGWKYAKLGDFFKGFGKEPYTIRFVALLPAPETKQQAKQSLATCRQLIEDALNDIRAETRGAKKKGS
ncbi:MAG TPA: lysophospholipid acyltransferase family protein [Spirochaetales bacterium]|nr:lysophospholipid acyltransferase family protein [Spirochaetales bacterium]HPS14289.1 lysophospholipid acyltransferase family protein [Spirochaetales bacterium]